MRQTLAGRRPEMNAATLVAGLVPPPHFAEATLDSYQPDPGFPSQGQARDAVSEFARESTGRRRASRGRGLYLDGGFGVGKTHLLAALAHSVGRSAAYGTFVEVTALVGALGFAAARDALGEFRLICVDEFELDDPGDTLLIARLMRELRERGVHLAATSNTPPGALGDGRFAAADFRREIQSLADAFSVLTIEGLDYRHRDSIEFPAPMSEQAVLAAGSADDATCDDWESLVDDLEYVHPSRLGGYVDGVRTAAFVGVGPLPDQARALRVVALVDCLYDRDVRVVASGGSLSEIFPAEMMAGGYRKKYLRALSRLAAMTEPGSPG